MVHINFVAFQPGGPEFKSFQHRSIQGLDSPQVVAIGFLNVMHIVTSVPEVSKTKNKSWSPFSIVSSFVQGLEKAT